MNPNDIAYSQAYTLRNEGGFVLEAYQDELGVWTVGGGCTGPDPFCSPNPTIGPGTAWTKEQAQSEFNHRHARAIIGAAGDIGPTWNTLNGNRQAAIVDTCYQEGAGNSITGIGGFAGYHHDIAAIQICDWPTAFAQYMNSKQAQQTPARAKRNGNMLLTGLQCPLTF